MAFGEVIRARRTEMRIGLNDMAARLGISAAYWSRVERGLESPPRAELIEKAAAILALRLDDLFVEARRLPPDMQKDIGRVVLAYRRMRATGIR